MNANTSKPKLSIQDMIAKIKAEQEAAKQEKQEPLIETPNTKTNTNATGMSGESITYNSNQQSFIDTVISGASCVLNGAAGTGKTTATQGAVKGLIDSGAIPILKDTAHKHLKDGAPGIVIISYTRRAVNNIRKVQSDDLKACCLTAHKLLEYAPVYYEDTDPETGVPKKTMRFEPSRNQTTPLPSSIKTILVEEASMLSEALYNEINAALLHKVQWIFIGDLNQLPPIFGPAILGFKLNELPVIELTEVYRQALESPIIRLAHRILSGTPLPAEEYPTWHVPNELTIHPWKKKLSEDLATNTAAAFFKKAYDNKLYDPEEDMILIPFNKSCGTLEVNKHMANHISKLRDELTYEVVAGFNKHYFSVGDYVLYDREDAVISEIRTNYSYTGARFQKPSSNLDYWGYNCKAAEERALRGESQEEIDDVDFLLEAVMKGEGEDRVNQASHEITVRLQDTGQEVSLTKAAEINNLLHSYALTVHKAQGSEWRKVFILLHSSHATMLQRELLYTAVTRAREELYVICEPESFTNGIKSQKIKGTTLAEKAEYFKGKQRK